MKKITNSNSKPIIIIFSVVILSVIIIFLSKDVNPEIRKIEKQLELSKYFNKKE